MQVIPNYCNCGSMWLFAKSDLRDDFQIQGIVEIRPVLRPAGVLSGKRAPGRVSSNLQYLEQPPVKEPPKEPRMPPIEEPGIPPGSPPAPDRPPVEDPPNEPKLPPIKEPPPGDSEREPA